MNKKKINLNSINLTAIMNYAALERKAEYERLMKSGEFSKYLRQELTMLYFVNNLNLITTLN